MTADGRDYRIEKFQALGFSRDEARALADSVDHAGAPVYWGLVERSLGAGLDHAGALELFISERVPQRVYE